MVFDNGSGPNNNPPQDPYDLNFTLHDSLASVKSDPERIDELIQTNYELDLANPIGTESGYDIFRMTVDLSYLSWAVTAGNTYYLHFCKSSGDPSFGTAIPLTLNPAGGDVIGGEDDYYRIGFLGSVSPLTEYFFGESQYFPAKVTIIIPARLPLGDADGDGIFNNQDIASFVLALTNPVAYQTMFPDIDPDVVLDMNGDGEFNNTDISGFVAALTGG